MSELIRVTARPATRAIRPSWNHVFLGRLAKLLAPFPVWGLVFFLHLHLPNRQNPAAGQSFAWASGGLIAAYAILSLTSIGIRPLRAFLLERSPLFLAFLVLLEAWDLVTLKFAFVPLPYFPGPEAVLAALVEDWELLGISTLYSLRLLSIGYAIGALLGLTSGVLVGWSPGVRYWLMPVLKVIGPIPATAWIPLSLVIFPTSFWASISLIALAVWFPVTMMTSSGISNVRVSHIEVARTLGARTSYLIWHVAIPSAMPSIFIGLFMGLGSSFLTLIVAEMLGVKAGLGWYVDWAKGWAEYNKVYAALAIIALFFSGIITLLFKVRDWVLVWQRAVIKW